MRSAQRPDASDVRRRHTSLPSRSASPSDSRAALSHAVRLLARGDRSTLQVQRYLTDRGHSQAATRSALRTLQRLGYLDDEAVALRLAQNRLERRPVGPTALIETLKQAFKNETAVRAAQKAYEGTTEDMVAARFLSALPVKFRDPLREARRRGALLRARGFSDEVIEQLITSEVSEQ